MFEPMFGYTTCLYVRTNVRLYYLFTCLKQVSIILLVYMFSSFTFCVDCRDVIKIFGLQLIKLLEAATFSQMFVSDVVL